MYVSCVVELLLNLEVLFTGGNFGLPQVGKVARESNAVSGYLIFVPYRPAVQPSSRPWDRHDRT